MHWGFWLALLILFLMAEAATVNMTTLWFAVGALCAMLTRILGGELWLQITVFLVVSGVALALLRPVAKRYFTPRLTKTNVDAVIGQTGRVVETIDNTDGVGRVKIAGMDWTARSATGEAIEEGTLVTVSRIEGVKAFVTPVKEAVKAE